MKLAILLIAIFLIPFAALHAQEESSTVKLTRTRINDTLVVAQQDTSAQKDLYDVIRSIFNKKGTVANKGTTVFGTKPVFSVLPAVGYTLQTKLAVTLSGNIAFRILGNSRISTISSNTAYTQNKQIIIPIHSNIWTTGDRFNFIGDLKYYKYPQSTFGLGTDSRSSNENPVDYTLVRFYETILTRVVGNLYAGAGFIYDHHFNVSEKGNPDGSVSDYALYGDKSSTTSAGITLNALIDMRDNPINPTRGFYAGVQFRDNKSFLGSTSPWTSLVIDVRKYYRFPASSHNVIAFWSYNWLVLNGKPPYLDLPAITWDLYNGTGRGYIQGRFRGAKMVYAESEYRYRITKNGLLGGVAFLNAESFSGAPGTRLQQVQPGYGAGLRLKLNKVSKTNIAIDYGFGNQGSKGVFITVGEIF
ncbi:outer membrane protein assembly factor [Mucilaginibacter sp. RB4R14]|uniref:BamA/TamA family outer membrane protein n=1 Tax=Mucilaginibacter aurantiaciroseus TaxID=2949308 RepID=UPI002091AB65|nr:BamA/TamA family outer membrane protein [Mucilaginibacter aurantiaciroseus]MCO5936168.1 outer membrane protein assembly factor [Mucilaginibacter aurantiaciroseus]